MEDVKRRLEALAQAMPWPETPNVSARVQAAIADEPRRASTRPAPKSRTLVPRWPQAVASRVALAVVLVLFAGTAAIPPARSAVLRWLGITGVSITKVKRLPPASTTARLALGQPARLAAARREASFKVRVPAALGRPDQVLVRGHGPTFTVTLVYRPRAGLAELPGRPGIALLLTEFRGRSTPFIDKMMLASSKIERTPVNGRPGWWLVDPHEVIVQYAKHGVIDLQSRRLVKGKVLIWESGGLALRLESELDRTAALRLATSLR